MSQDAQLQWELLQHQAQLEGVISQLCEGQQTPSLLESGLLSAHSLKALAAVDGRSDLETYATELERVFYVAQQESQPDYEALVTQLNRIQFQYRANRQPNVGNELGLIDHLVHVVRDEERRQEEDQMTRRRRTVSPERYEGSRSKAIDLEAIFEGFAPWLRRAAEQAGKEIEIRIIVPEPIALRPDAVGPLQTSLIHLLRNALYHGIERPETRLKKGKSKRGTIQLEGRLEGDVLQIMVSDDGRGLEGENDIIVEPDRPIYSCNANTATKSSIFAIEQTGLGVGLPIVHKQVTQLGGDFDLKSIPNCGTVAVIDLQFWQLD